MLIKAGYSMDIMRQSECLVVNPIKVYSCGYLFNLTTVGKALESMTALQIGRFVPDACLWLDPSWPNMRFSLALTISGS